MIVNGAEGTPEVRLAFVVAEEEPYGVLQNFGSIGSTRKLLQDVLRQELLDLTMARHWLRNSRSQIAIPIMISAVADKDASCVFQGADQVDPLHPTDSSATLRIPGISPLVRSL